MRTQVKMVFIINFDDEVQTYVWYACNHALLIIAYGELVARMSTTMKLRTRNECEIN